MNRTTPTEFLHVFNTILKRYMLTGNTLAIFLSKTKENQMLKNTEIIGM